VFKPRGRFFDKKFRLLIEDFYSKTDVEQQTQIDELLIGTSLANQTNGNSLNFYSTAFDNLLKAVPNLETITIDGGYVLKPAFGVSILDMSALKITFLDRRRASKRDHIFKGTYDFDNHCCPTTRYRNSLLNSRCGIFV
jgi:hypothetical protein